MQFIAGFGLALAGTLASPVCAAGEPAPWRLDERLGTPAGLTLSGEHRTRVEGLGGQFRAGRSGGDQALAFRTLLKAELVLGRIAFTGEMMDSRATLVDEGSPLSTSLVNPLELLQAHVSLAAPDLLTSGSTTRLRAGRLTMDLGKRRLVARNRFRNTINGFTGLDLQWQGAGGRQLRAFYTLPVQRRIGGSLLDPEPRFDSEDSEVQLWGLFFAGPGLPWGSRGEVYLLGLHEDDAPGRATRNRELLTAGLRLYREPAPGHIDYELESMYQWGDSRASSAAALDLEHRAHFQHLELGYTFDAPARPQLLFQFDYASGDDDPGDDENNRFDTLFGARRFDFGPTSQFGPFARANLVTPGMRLRFAPARALKGFVSFRGFWLADSDDAWTTAGIANPPGESETHIGTQLEARVRVAVLPRNLRLELGAAQLFAGDLMQAAGKDDSTYVYTQLVVWF